MPCDKFNLPGGGYAIVCTRGGYAIVCTRGKSSKPCVNCGKHGSKLCDYPLTGAKKGSTCDRSLCERCAVHQEPDLDFCPTHARMLTADGKLRL